MKALVVKEFGGPLLAEDIAVPAYGPEEVLVRVRACAVDQFDLTIRDGKFPTAKTPIVLGHEIAGEVVEVGSAVDNVKAGDRVVSTLYLTCGRCRFCRTGRETICADFKGYVGIHSPGAYAEYTTIPAVNLVKLPEQVSFAEGSVIANAIGTPYHAFTKRAKLQPGERVIITGAGGGVGIHAVQLAVMMGAHVMAVDIGAEKLNLAKELGAEVVCDPTHEDFSKAALDWTQGEGVEVILELVGTATFENSFKSLGRGGRMVIVGSHSGGELHAAPQLMIRYEWEILGSRNVTKVELTEVVGLVASGKIKPIVTGRYPLEEAEKIHEQLRAGKISGRVVLEP
ncbi:MAG: alcohol dehydrogenase catalytic domain-containing protein [Anaerolineae bacterium]|nr:alcohol dehydrogenase catalytic domain-containing protein [Anaerolineae bacterium]